MSANKEDGFNKPFEKLNIRLERAAARAVAKRAEAPEPQEPDVAFEEAPPPRDDTSIFRDEMAGVRPLHLDPIAPRTREVSVKPPPTDHDVVVGELEKLVSGQGDFDIVWSDEHIEGIASGIDRRMLKKLRKGEFSRRAHLDLHGKTRKEARPMVQEFLTDSRRRGHRCVLIVHGRGLNSKDRVPVLKDSLRIWLTRSGISKSVLAFCSARPVDGGLGAVYVLLRR